MISRWFFFFVVSIVGIPFVSAQTSDRKMGSHSPDVANHGQVPLGKGDERIKPSRGLPILVKNRLSTPIVQSLREKVIQLIEKDECYSATVGQPICRLYADHILRGSTMVRESIVAAGAKNLDDFLGQQSLKLDPVKKVAWTARFEFHFKQAAKEHGLDLNLPYNASKIQSVLADIITMGAAAVKDSNSKGAFEDEPQGTASKAELAAQGDLTGGGKMPNMLTPSVCSPKSTGKTYGPFGVCGVAGLGKKPGIGPDPSPIDAVASSGGTPPIDQLKAMSWQDPNNPCFGLDPTIILTQPFDATSDPDLVRLAKQLDFIKEWMSIFKAAKEVAEKWLKDGEVPKKEGWSYGDGEGTKKASKKEIQELKEKIKMLEKEIEKQLMEEMKNLEKKIEQLRKEFKEKEETKDKQKGEQDDKSKPDEEKKGGNDPGTGGGGITFDLEFAKGQCQQSLDGCLLGPVGDIGTVSSCKVSPLKPVDCLPGEIGCNSGLMCNCLAGSKKQACHYVTVEKSNLAGGGGISDGEQTTEANNVIAMCGSDDKNGTKCPPGCGMIAGGGAPYFGGLKAMSEELDCSGCGPAKPSKGGQAEKPLPELCQGLPIEIFQALGCGFMDPSPQGQSMP